MPILISILSIIFLYAGVPWIHRQLARNILERKAKEQNALILTFDDGPGSSLTPEILNILDENGARATFFLLGKNIAGREEIVRQIAEHGHNICSHGYDHLNGLKASPFHLVSDINRGWQEIDTALGTIQKKYPFRPPNGRLNIITLLYLWIKHVPIVYWSLDSKDTWREKLNSERIKELIEEAGGAVFLVHDFDRKNEDTRQYVIGSVKAALAIAADKGMQILTVSELLKTDR